MSCCCACSNSNSSSSDIPPLCLSHTPFLIVWKGARDLSSKPVRNTFRALNYRKAVWIGSAASNAVSKDVSVFEGTLVAHEGEGAHVRERAVTCNQSSRLLLCEDFRPRNFKTSVSFVFLSQRKEKERNLSKAFNLVKKMETATTTTK